MKHLIRHLGQLCRRIFHVRVLDQARDDLGLRGALLLTHEGFQEEIEHVSNRHVPKEAAKKLKGLSGVMDELIAEELFDSSLSDAVDGFA